jgi:hypothetical protein
VQGQGELATESSNDIPENHITSKAEYTNTQQGLPINWVYLDHERLKGSRFLLLKNNKSMSLIPYLAFRF